ncbi:hypothetical protein [Nocardia niigatensis]
MVGLMEGCDESLTIGSMVAGWVSMEKHVLPRLLTRQALDTVLMSDTALPG